MVSIEKTTIKIPMMVAVVAAVASVGVGVVANYYATISAVEVGMEKIDRRIDQVNARVDGEIKDRSYNDQILSMRITANEAVIDAVNTYVSKTPPPVQK